MMLNEMSNMNVMRRMIALVTPLFGWMTLAVCLGVLGFLCAIFIPVGAAVLIAQGLDVIDWFRPSHIIIAMGLMAILRGVLRYGEQACNHYIAFKLLAILRDKVFAKLRTLAPAKLEGEDKGNLISMITSDIELLEVFYAHTISPILIAIFTSIILLFFFYQLHVLFFIIALFAYLYVGLRIPLWVTKQGKQQGEAYRKQSGELSSYTLESIRGLDDIVQYEQGQERLMQMQKQADGLHRLQSYMRDLEGKSVAKSGTAVQGFALLILFCVLGFAQHGAINFGEGLIAIVLMLSSFGPVIAISNLSNNLLLTLASGRRILTLLDEEPQVEDVTSTSSSTFGDMKAESVRFTYGDAIILDDFNYEMKQGKITGILGKSGCGKSTLLKLLMRFWQVNRGKISIHGQDIHNIDTSQLRSMQSLVTQETILFHDTIEHNLKIAKPQATREEVEIACKQANIHEFIMSLANGYETMVSELGESLSGGERQRIALARAFLHDSECILLDEPTSNLDGLNESIILQSLSQLQDKTIVLVSHRASTLNICDTILHMQEGRSS